ncbi:2-oxoisovalerate dehydrogenase [Candidatus Magnetominusculus xianensis]|uniref:2-oxoisovalerate dehydrogenase E1 subunit beta n=1 Tax=Candidatus Magnetominusculus xianensis TaxID=1748249 RepID=A0ABR5SFK8_9BACT|nr:2-oxoisovalerate dehydrogenase [Candidatus Magnetominusculus xianensis]KWT86739.1 2-oxoisovalerate dehydrogenase E1 subunit beta [Candidatus Magnetominusculus xianensis]MBF0402542.1 2-oxoisovalerate dehydrogenase [Nitrospirota bacterium]
MNEIIFIVEKDIEGGFCAHALNHSIITEANNLDDLKINIKDAIRCHFNTEEETPKIIRLHMVIEEVFSYA